MERNLLRVVTVTVTLISIIVTPVFAGTGSSVEIAEQLPEATDFVEIGDDLTGEDNDLANALSVDELSMEYETDAEDLMTYTEGFSGGHNGKSPKFLPPQPLPKLSGDWRTDFIEVAKSQIGYKEADDRSSYFGDWLGQTYNAWCSEFVSWCAYAADIPDDVIKPGLNSNDFLNFFASKGRVYFIKGAAGNSKSKVLKKYGIKGIETISPDDLRPGDILLCGRSKGPNHTSIFIGWDKGKTVDISGNCGNCVKTTTRDLNCIWGVCKPDYNREGSPLNLSEGDTSVTLSKSELTYNGKIRRPKIKVKYGDKYLKNGLDYKIAWFNEKSVNVGTYTFNVLGIGEYTGIVSCSYKICKASNPLEVKGKKISIKAADVKSAPKEYKASKVISFKNKGAGKLSYKKVSGDEKISINKDNGKLIVRKGLKKGSYPVKIKVKSRGDDNHKNATKTVTVKINVI